ncbi:MAG: carboxylate--amine ligase [Firmicutes bacterium]|nr:carboxylate--amine ligase [Bacillota bacterium]
MKTQIPVVILGANFYTSLGAIRTLGRHGVPVYALDYHFPTAYALSSKYVTEKILCPDINNDESGLAQFLLDLGKKFDDRPVLMATADSYALLVSRYADELNKYFRFPEMPSGLLEQIIDKNSLSELAERLGLRAPQTFIVDENADISYIASEINYPCIIKPALSHKFVKVFRQKCLFADGKEELITALEDARSSNLNVMVQEVIPGFDDHMYVFDVYINRDGKATHTFTAQKLRQFPINFGSSTLTHHRQDQTLVDLGLDYMEKLGYRGYGEIEFKKHSGNNQFYLIEINARLSTLNILFDKCGVEFTYVIYRDLIGDPLPDFHLTEDQPWAFWHAYEDFISVSAYLRKKQLTLKEVISPWISHHKAHAIWATDDIRPIFSFSRLILGKIADKLCRIATRKSG